MKENLTISIDTEVYSVFKHAVELANVSQEEALDTCIRWYSSAILKQKAEEIQPDDFETFSDSTSDFYAKALNKIPRWAKKPNQYNHKIIKAYLMAEEMDEGNVRLTTMENLCSNESNEQLFVANFRNNYNSMKSDSQNSNGKVFEDDGTCVWLWDEVEQIVRKYSNYFYNSEN